MFNAIKYLHKLNSHDIRNSFIVTITYIRDIYIYIYTYVRIIHSEYRQYMVFCQLHGEKTDRFFFLRQKTMTRRQLGSMLGGENLVGSLVVE